MFRSRTPQKDRRGRFWDWVNPPLGRGVNCWVAGVLVGVETHWMGRTQPCRFYLTGGALKCYCHDNKLGTEWKGYIPLLDENGVQCFAIVGERYADLALSIPLWAAVTVTRLRSAGSPVCVKQSAWTDNPPPNNGEKLVGKDIRPWLLKLWRDQTLIEWFASHGSAAGEPDPAHLDPAKFTPMMREPAKKGNAALDRHRAAQRAAAGNDLPPTIAETIAAVPSVNGKKKH